MDIKLKNISRKKSTKTAVFILTVILIVLTVVQFQFVSYNDIIPESLIIREYSQSEYFLTQEVRNAWYEINSVMENRGEVPKSAHYYYFISDGEKTYSNVEGKDKNFFKQFDKAFYSYEMGTWTIGENTNPGGITKFYVSDGYTIYISYPDEFINEKQQEWEESRDILVPFAVRVGVLAVLILTSIIFLMVQTGKNQLDDEIHLTKIDSIFSDVLFSFFIPLAAFWIIGISNLYYSGMSHVRQMYSAVWIGIITAFISVMCGIILLSLTRKAKSGRLFKHTVVYLVFYKIYDFFKSLYDGRMFERYPLTKSLFYRQLVFITSSAFLVFLTFLFFLLYVPLFFIPPVVEIVIIYWYIKGNNKTFEDINKGFNESLGEQMKAERMKIALVTNVSHDLKTPLTSIISYVDLLSKEEDLSETVRDYVNVLSEKSNRLKNIVSDLFDLAKSTSGDIPLDMESLDIKKLIEQTLGDMEDEIEKSNLQIKTKLPENSLNIYSDGKKLYRVFQNVIDNALKYALPGTRVYVELEEIDGKAVAKIKNTAGYEMEFTAEEILQRFSRGDKSRTTEGSGLGLSIAESFTNVCGGKFKVEIDGDLFKVQISFNLDK
ncbi:MAG: HAMP domain-containing sensor histidine kinase [Sedimentibacter saalensis]|uniref:sensor histidine kinase n=1 Tax=Sedimentibacter saalensis TaxID=130788 RepID=UPI002B211F79|nr:HAMP domain-containing sensor histidine kinase [Sedimentibacter saalensis]MEA5096532.1 HAMP domain-containing sensor histidine kinase [Sedimentibacter saalensis]